MVVPSPYYAASPVRRSAPSFPFGWGAVTVLLVGAALLIFGILLILYGFLSFLTGTIGQATSSSFSVTEFFQSFFGAVMLFVIGGVLAGIGGRGGPPRGDLLFVAGMDGDRCNGIPAPRRGHAKLDAAARVPQPGRTGTRVRHLVPAFGHA